MPECFFCLKVSLVRSRSYIAAAAITASLLFLSGGVRASAQADASDQGKTETVREFAYVVNNNYGNDFSGYKVDIATGKLTQLPGSPFAPGSYVPEYSAINGLALDLKHKFLYSTAAGGITPPNMILGFSIGAKGALTPLSSPAAVGGAYISLVVDPSNKFLYAAGPTPGLNGFSINPTTGLLTSIPGASYYSSALLGNVIIDPTGKFLYVQEFLSGSLEGFQINRSTGALTAIPGSPYAGISGGLAIDPTGRFLYAFTGIGGVSVNEYLIDKHTGALTLSPESPFASPLGFAGAAIDPSGNFLYVATNHDLDTAGVNELAGFSIDCNTGALTPLKQQPVALSAGPKTLTVDPSGSYVYVTLNDNTVTGFAIKEKNGALKALPGLPLPTGAGPANIVVGAFLHK
jgi:6-phosphogluconolactonase